MHRFHATERPVPYEGHAVLDIFHVWPDGHVENGVKHRSWLFVYLQQPPPEGEKVAVTMHLPGGRVESRELEWGQEWYTDAPTWGVASAYAEGGYPIEFFWELTPGKA